MRLRLATRNLACGLFQFCKDWILESIQSNLCIEPSLWRIKTGCPQICQATLGWVQKRSFSSISLDTDGGGGVNCPEPIGILPSFFQIQPAIQILLFMVCTAYKPTTFFLKKEKHKKTTVPPSFSCLKDSCFHSFQFCTCWNSTIGHLSQRR